MNCTCVSDLEKKLLAHFSEQGKYKKPVKGVRILGIAITFGRNETKIRTCSSIEVELEGQKKKETISMFHTFCPFCGIKQDDKQTGKEA